MLERPKMLAQIQDLVQAWAGEQPLFDLFALPRVQVRALILAQMWELAREQERAKELELDIALGRARTDWDHVQALEEDWDHVQALKELQRVLEEMIANLSPLARGRALQLVPELARSLRIPVSWEASLQDD